jgi:NAD(P)-dependent dehydrogenase (short-subunit alcohol dehydrogenase family)
VTAGTVSRPVTESTGRLAGQTVVVIGGSSGIGLETARLARAEGAAVMLTGRDPERLGRAADDVQASSAVSFDATDRDRLDRYFAELPTTVDHIVVTAGRPYYAPLAEIDLHEAQQDIEGHLLLPITVAQHAVHRVRSGGTLLFFSGTGARRPGIGLTVASTLTTALPALIANLALEIAPIRVNLIAPGFVDTPLSAELLGDQLDERRAQLAATLPIGRVVRAEDVAALAVHLMTNTALTGATYDIDGGQQLTHG